MPSAVNRHEGATATPCLSPAYFSALEIPPDLPYHRFFTPCHKPPDFGFYSISDTFPTSPLKADTRRMWREYRRYSAFIYLPCLLLYAYLVWTVDETVNSEIANTINNFSNVIYTIILGTIGIIIICASLKKNYYVVFNYNDVTHKYKFLPVSINLIFILVLTTINQIILYTCNHIVCYVCIYPLIIFAIILSGYLLLVTLILLFQIHKLN